MVFSCVVSLRLCVVLLSVVWFLACSGVPAGDVPETLAPTLMSSPVVDGDGEDLPVLAVHGGPRLVNLGADYVYGELLRADGCLRVSCFASGEAPLVGGDLLLVWPLGYDLRDSDGLVVLGPDGDVVAAVGERVRLSGERLRDNWHGFEDLDWFYGGEDDCEGSYWLVGDEVTSVSRPVSDARSNHEVFFPTLPHQTGGVVMTLEGMPGRLALRGDCLVLEVAGPPWEYFVVWPPGFRAVDIGDGLTVVNGGGSVIAMVGDDVILGGRGGPSGVSYSTKCEGDYYNAYSVEVGSGN